MNGTVVEMLQCFLCHKTTYIARFSVQCFYGYIFDANLCSGKSLANHTFLKLSNYKYLILSVYT